MAREMSLRDLGREIGVTAAYIADLESNRRLPSAELKHKISTALDIPLEDLEEADNRLSLRSSGLDPTATPSRKPASFPSHIAAVRQTHPAPKPASKAPQSAAAARGYLVTWESELRAMASEASAWSIETGGDLFGRWQDIPTLFLATKAGPNAKRDHAHFRLDVAYLRGLSERWHRTGHFVISVTGTRITAWGSPPRAAATKSESSLSPPAINSWA